jgi:hypothetical protein
MFSQKCNGDEKTDLPKLIQTDIVMRTTAESCYE